MPPCHSPAGQPPASVRLRRPEEQVCHDRAGQDFSLPQGPLRAKRLASCRPSVWLALTGRLSPSSPARPLVGPEDGEFTIAGGDRFPAAFDFAVTRFRRQDVRLSSLCEIFNASFLGVHVAIPPNLGPTRETTKWRCDTLSRTWIRKSGSCWAAIWDWYYSWSGEDWCPLQQGGRACPLPPSFPS